MDEPGYATRIGHEELRRFSLNALNAVELSEEYADIVVDAAVDARQGIETHGSVRLEPYVEVLRKDGINPNLELSVFQYVAGAAVVDDHDWPGQATTLRAMRKAMELADDTGSAFVGVRNSDRRGLVLHQLRRRAHI